MSQKGDLDQTLLPKRTTDVSNVPTPPILCLPHQLRRRVYFLAGLAPLDHDGVPFILDLHGDFDTPSLGFHGLLLSCRAIYTEASALLYSLNKFVIRMPPNGPYAMYLPQRTGLAPLRALTDSSLASLRHLKITISEASCHHQSRAYVKSACCDYVGIRLHNTPPPDRCVGRGHTGHEGPLQAGDPFAEATLDEWQSTATLLASRGLSLANLELSLVCDVRFDEPQMAQLAAAPLCSLAPLKDCHVRLCKQYNTKIQTIAEGAILRGRGIPLQHTSVSTTPETSCKDSRLLALPREIRFQILKYTDLITPWKEVTWDRLSAKYSASRINCCHYRSKRLKRTLTSADHHGCQFSRCWLDDSSMGCFCRLIHSASSSKCRCWVSPLALFLVCRTLYEDAQVVFFSGNRFVVHDFDSSRPWRAPSSHPGVGYSMQRLAISIFLTDVVPAGCLGLLRFVEMVFPPYPYYAWPRSGVPALEDWKKCVRFIRDEVNAPALTLRLYMTDSHHLVPQEDRVHMSKEEGLEILKAYKCISGPLTKLGRMGLANFYCHFVWPWTSTRETQRRIWKREDGRQWLARKEADLEEQGKRWVMRDRYDTVYISREEPPKSLWKLSLERD